MVFHDEWIENIDGVPSARSVGQHEPVENVSSLVHCDMKSVSAFDCRFALILFPFVVFTQTNDQPRQYPPLHGREPLESRSCKIRRNLETDLGVDHNAFLWCHVR